MGQLIFGGVIVLVAFLVLTAAAGVAARSGAAARLAKTVGYLLMALGIVVAAASGVVVIDAGEVGVRHAFGKVDPVPLLPGVRFVEVNDIAALEAAFSQRTAGVFIEWIQGEGGVRPLDTAFCRRARELADRYDALLCFDEIQCGVGRTGKHFAYQLAEPAVMPDIMIAAKPVACGIPLGIIVANERAAASIRPGMHGSTFGGNALATRVALEFLEILDDLLPHIITVRDYFRAELRRIATKYPFISEVRGYGLMIGIQLTVPGKDMVTRAREEGLLVNCTQDTVLRFLPPYILTEGQVDEAVAALDRVFAGEPLK